MDIKTWFFYVVLGAVLGACGQVGRTIIGLKKMNDAKSAKPTEGGNGFDVKKLVVSLILGAVAGVLAAIGLWKPEMTTGAMNRDVIVAIIVSGYAGADFIEGFIQKSGIAQSTKKD